MSRGHTKMGWTDTDDVLVGELVAEGVLVGGTNVFVGVNVAGLVAV